MNKLKTFQTAFVLFAMMFFVGLATPSGANAQAAPMAANQVVKAHGYVSLDRVPRGKEFEVAVVATIHEGYHMNSHKPLDEYLIPTTMTANAPAGLKVVDTIYPPGSDKKFPFSPKKPLNVYTGSVTLRLRMKAEPNAKIGKTTIPVTLRYQACSMSACLPPVKIPVEVPVDIAAASAASHPANKQVFSKTGM
ncbi:MAG TPA: protein-disulfide reductase DsbD domain-containing protein [Candidatus Dormibacteraeota bacterium]|nr:protein-disulfide reductase DsbD domain-containing protein [Candidatus Dormibacteraeota bacterium]